MIVIYILGALVITLAILVGVLWFIGRSIPVEHVAVSEIGVPVSPERAFALIEDIEQFPSWEPSTTKVIIMPDRNALQVCRVEQGRNAFVLTRVRHEPPRALERSIEDKMFSGTWLYTLTPSESGCTVRLKETGRIGFPIARAVMKHFAGYHTYVNKHLAALGEKLGSRDRVHKL